MRFRLVLLCSPIIRCIEAALLTLAAVALLLNNLRKSGERGARLTERRQTQEQTHIIMKYMIDSAANRTRDRDALTQRLRDGEF